MWLQKKFCSTQMTIQIRTIYFFQKEFFFNSIKGRYLPNPKLMKRSSVVPEKRDDFSYLEVEEEPTTKPEEILYPNRVVETTYVSKFKMSFSLENKKKKLKKELASKAPFKEFKSINFGIGHILRAIELNEGKRVFPTENLNFFQIAILKEHQKYVKHRLSLVKLKSFEIEPPLPKRAVLNFKIKKEEKKEEAKEEEESFNASYLIGEPEIPCSEHELNEEKSDGETYSRHTEEPEIPSYEDERKKNKKKNKKKEMKKKKKEKKKKQEELQLAAKFRRRKTGQSSQKS